MSSKNKSCCLGLYLLLALSGCDNDGGSGSKSSSTEKFGQWHERKQELEFRVSELTNAPGGPNYPAIIDLYEKSDWPADVVDLRVGATIVGSYNDPKPERHVVQTLDEGFSRMERSVQAAGESRIITPQFLRLRFERGVGKAPNYVMAPIPALADCWMKVEKDSYDDKIDDPAQVTTCIALRKKLMTEK